MNLEELGNKFLPAKDRTLEDQNALRNGEFHRVKNVEKSEDYILEDTFEEPPAKVQPDYNVICQKAVEAMKEKGGECRRHHPEWLTGDINALGDGVKFPQAQPGTDEGLLLSTLTDND